MCFKKTFMFSTEFNRRSRDMRTSQHFERGKREIQIGVIDLPIDLH